MALVVAKFGGTSVASPDRIQMVAKRLIEAKQTGNQVVAVVSAMGKTTDELLGLARALNTSPTAREMDMLLSTGEQVSMALLAMAIQARGYSAKSYTGWQAGITTDSFHGRAKIEDIAAHRIKEELDRGSIVIVAGFQGITAAGDITTLGRGGSDTTAVALAYALKADVCEIYSDVDGVYTADPRVAPRAQKLSEICYDDMLELSNAGAGVLQARAVEFARKFGVVIHSRSAFSSQAGTLIKETISMEHAVISGIAHDTSEVRVTLCDVVDTYGVAAQVFSALAASSINVDMIIQNTSHNGETDISFTCPESDLERARETVERMMPKIGFSTYEVDTNIAKVSLVGTGMKSSPGVAAKTFEALAQAHVNILMISTSPIRLSVVIEAEQVTKAVRALHTAFNLDSESVYEETMLSAEEIAAKMQKGR